LRHSNGDQQLSLTKDVGIDIKAAKKLRMPAWGVVCGIVGSFLCAQLFEHFGKPNFVLPTLNSVRVLGFTLGFKRKLWRHALVNMRESGVAISS